ncbi:hypothetical protein HC248_02460 [Polaromonas vacuolata]|uniref:Uncharacterized protein n=1 Tax=Polaromonas vacuolata TaxID=37448 RepID=A0A6H2HC18_9BURK|nr:hypothetical protein [Polaromonas vacuolata]QJC57144.1 hypothetical protein HC248_02460 [Polaromonas vacuolata]
MISAKPTGIVKRDVSAVSAVQASVYAGLGCYGTNSADVSDVSLSRSKAVPDTADTAWKNMPYQRKPNAHAACTPDTSETSCLNNVQCKCLGLKAGGV